MPVPRRRRNRAVTRGELLAAGFDEVYRHGFQGASIDRILDRVEVTKGAFFHYFPTKTDFGYALVGEVITQMIRAQWVQPLAGSDDPLATIGDAFEAGVVALEAAPLRLGCPLNNLAREMSPLDDGFRLRTQRLFEIWIQTYELALRRGQAHGRVDATIDPQATAFALVAELKGILSLARNSQARRTLRLGLTNLRRCLESLCPDPGVRRPKRGRARR